MTRQGRLVGTWCASIIHLVAVGDAQALLNHSAVVENPRAMVSTQPNQTMVGIVQRHDAVASLIRLGRLPIETSQWKAVDSSFSEYSSILQGALERTEKAVVDLADGGRAISGTEFGALADPLQEALEGAFVCLLDGLVAATGADRQLLREQLLLASIGRWIAETLDTMLCPEGAGIDLVGLLMLSQNPGQEFAELEMVLGRCSTHTPLSELVKRYHAQCAEHAKACYGLLGPVKLRELMHRRGLGLESVRHRADGDLAVHRSRWGKTNLEWGAAVATLAMSCEMRPTLIAQWTERYLRALYPALVPPADVADEVLVIVRQMGLSKAERAQIELMLDEMHRQRSENYLTEIAIVRKWLSTVGSTAHPEQPLLVPAQVVSAHDRTRSHQVRFALAVIAAVQSTIVRDEVRRTLSEWDDLDVRTACRWVPRWQRFALAPPEEPSHEE